MTTSAYQGGTPVVSITKTELDKMIAYSIYNPSVLYRIKDDVPDANQFINGNITAKDKTWSANRQKTGFSTLNMDFVSYIAYWHSI